DRGGRGVADGHAILLHDAPEAILVRVVGCPLVHHGGGAVGEGPVDDVGVAGDPPDVGGAPVHVRVAKVEDPLGGRVDPGQVATGGVHDTLGLAGGARGVEQV